MGAALKGGIACAFIDIREDFWVGAELRQHAALERETTLLGFDSGPAIGAGLFTAGVLLRLTIEFRVIGVVGDRARVPKDGVLPGRSADNERRAREPSLHAAAAALADHRHARLDKVKLRERFQLLERLTGAAAKLGCAADLDALDDFPPPGSRMENRG